MQRSAHEHHLPRRLRCRNVFDGSCAAATAAADTVPEQSHAAPAVPTAAATATVPTNAAATAVATVSYGVSSAAAAGDIHVIPSCLCAPT